MALEAGGYAEKLGNRYEANWVAYQLLRLLDEEISSVVVEPLGDDEVGTDLIIENKDSSLEHHQCKAGAGEAETWSASLLESKGMLWKAFEQITRGKRDFVVVSPLPSKQLSDLQDSAKNSPADAMQFYEHQIKVSETRKKTFDYVCDKLNLNTGNSSDLGKARHFLSHLHIQPYTIDKHTNGVLNALANKLFVGNPVSLVNYLKHYADNENKLRVRITHPQLFKDLAGAGFERKLVESDERLAPVFETVNSNFKQSISPFLISKTLICRPELEELVTASDQSAVTLLTAEAGMGKSALLLELMSRLESTDVLVLSVRLDRNKLESNADAFGKSLGFPYSPVHCAAKYASNKKAVLLLDQLDAIRWTAAHSDNALQVCQEMVEQVLTLRRDGIDISVVFASRDFDVAEDIALNAWLKSIESELNRVKLSKLPEKSVEALISSYVKYETLSELQKETLMIPLWLGIFISIAESEGRAPDFVNKLELVKEYWQNRMIEACKISDAGQVQQLINELIHLMIKNSKLSIAESSLHNVSLVSIKALLSAGLVTIQNKQISFRHQALFDYQVGVRLFEAAQRSHNELLDEIGDFSQQTLTRREHLKYAISMLLVESQKDFCEVVLFLLKSEDIRFHLKYLLFNSIKEIQHLKAPAKQLIDEIVNSPSLYTYFLSISSYGNSEIISYLSKKGVICKWLNSKDDDIVWKTTRLLSSIADDNPSLVIREVQPFFGTSPEWNNRVYDCLCWDMENDSDEMFELRKQLLTSGTNARFINWKTIAIKRPERALQLLELLIEHYKEVLNIPRYASSSKVDSISNRDTFSESDIEGVEKIAEKIPVQTLERLLLKIHSIVADISDEDAYEVWLSKDRYSNYDAGQSITHCLFSVIEAAGKKLTDKPAELINSTSPYLDSANPIMNHLIAKLLLNLDISKADFVIAWLLSAPSDRLNCGNTYVEPEWRLPGLLVEKFSPNCALDIFKKLEDTIYYYWPDQAVDFYRWRLEARRGGEHYSYWGEVQHFLLPALDPDRVSKQSKQLISVLNRKFAGYTEKDFCKAFHLRMSGGMVTSPLPVGNRLSDGAWVKLILTPEDRSNRGTWQQAGKEVVHESSIEQFARSLDTAVMNQPERFARLALTLPKDIPHQYVEWIYYGLANTDKNRVRQEYQEKWTLCPVILLEKVIQHFGFKGFEYQVTRILESRISEDGWSDETIDLLVTISKTAKDPKPEKLNITISGEVNEVQSASISTLANNAINCCRGVAYGAIGNLYWKSEKWALQLIGSLDDAINDPHPAVNYSSSNLLLPLFNYNRKLAHKKFLELCSKDLRMTCIRGNHYFFNDGFTEESGFRQKYVDLVLKMKVSEIPEVSKEAGREILARWFFYDLFESDIQAINGWFVPIKSGASSVISQFLSEAQFNSKIGKLLPIYKTLANDEDKKILEKIGSSVRNKQYWDRLEAEEFFSILAQSKASLFCLWQIFHSIDEYRVSLLDISSNLLQLVKNVVNSREVSRDQRDLNIRESDLIKILQRLYEEASNDENDDAINQCLDIWDHLLSAQIYTAINATKKLENGMLN